MSACSITGFLFIACASLDLGDGLPLWELVLEDTNSHRLDHRFPSVSPGDRRANGKKGKTAQRIEVQR